MPTTTTTMMTPSFAQGSRGSPRIGDAPLPVDDAPRLPPTHRGRFFGLCGSPIQTTSRLQTFDDEDTSSPAVEPARPTVQDERDDEACNNDGEEQEEEEEGVGSQEEDFVGWFPYESIITPAAACPAQLLRLDMARKARIPLFLSSWFTPRRRPVPLPRRVADGILDTEAEEAARRQSSIYMRELELGQVIGEGAFGKVYVASWRGQSVAVKVLLRQLLSDEVVREFETEVRIMSVLHHPNICRLLGACLEPSKRALVLELVDRGSLWHVLRANGSLLTSQIRRRFVLDIARGMRYLHSFSHPILHRDMKSPNLLVERDYTIKIADFGLARVKAHVKTMTGNCGTVQWMAPEVLGNRKYTEKADVYSFGIVVWEIFTGQCPYENKHPIQIGVNVLTKNLRPPIPAHCPKFFARLMRSCWAREPERRPSFDRILRACEVECL